MLDSGHAGSGRQERMSERSLMLSVARLVPEASHVLDLGCGHGRLLASWWSRDDGNRQSIPGFPDIESARANLAR
ncbi:methionine biosynthesis protein MetW [Bradyrhizobium sp. RDT10]